MTDNNSDPGAKGSAALLEPPQSLSEPPTPARVEAQPSEPTIPASTIPLVYGNPPSSSAPPALTYQPTPYTPTPTPGQPGPIQMPQQPFYNAIPTPQPRGNPAVWVILGVLLAIVVFGAILFAATFAITGNAVRNATTNTGPVTTDTQSIPVGSNTSAGIDLNMGAGDIAVMGGSANLVDATFVYNVPGWKPNAVFNIQGNSGTFQVSQPDVRNISGNMRNEWTLRLSNKIPADVKINLGAGNVDVRLGGVPAKTLNIDNHAGNTTVDLTGQWKNNLDATVTNALGNATIRVPSDVGVRITTHRGLGNITADGLKANGNVYTNDAYGKSAVTLNIDATVNLGNLVMVAEKEMKTQGD